MNWILIAVIAIIAVNALIGRKAGFIKTVFSLVSLMVALLLTVCISPTVNNMLKNNEKFYGMVSDKVDIMISKDDKNTDTKDQEAYINNLKLPKSFKNALIEGKNKSVDNIREYIVSDVTDIIIKALAFLITFIVILIVLWALCFALDIISKLPMLNQINKTAGLFAGALHGLVIVWLLFILLTVFGGSKFGREAFKMIEGNPILSFIYDNNIIMEIFTGAKKLF